MLAIVVPKHTLQFTRPFFFILSNIHLSETHQSAPASPPAPAVPTGPSFPLKYQSTSAKYDAVLCGFPNSLFSSQWDGSNSVQSKSSACHSLTHSTSFTESNMGLQIPFSTSQGSLKVLLLHGNLDICHSLTHSTFVHDLIYLGTCPPSWLS